MPLSKLLRFIDDAAEFKIKPQTIQELKALEGGEDVVGRLQKEFDLTTLQSGELFAQPKAIDSTTKAIEAEIGHLTEMEDVTSNYAGKLLNGEVPGGESPVSHMLNTSATISGVTLPQNMLKNWQKLHDTAGIINAKLMPTEFELLPSTTNWDGAKIKGGIWHVIANPKNAFDELSADLVAKPTNLKHTADRYGKHARDTWKKLTKGLGNADIDALNGVLAAANDSEEVLTPVMGGLKSASGDVFKVNDKVREAYYGTRMLMDHMYWLNNTAAVRQANERGFKLLETVVEGVKNKRVVKTVKGRHGETYAELKLTHGEPQKAIKWSKDMEDNGWQVIEFQGKDGTLTKIAMSPEQKTGFLRQIDEGTDMIGYRKGYVPVIYKDQWAVNRIARLKDGTYRANRIASAPTRVKANKAVAEFPSKFPAIEDEVDVMFVASRKNDVTTDVAYGENMHSILDNLSATELRALKASLVKMGLDPDVADSLERTGKFFSHKRNPFMMKRGMRLTDWTGEQAAEILPSDAAIQKYLNASASYAANADYTGKLEKSFLDEFGELLTDPTDYLSPFKKGSNLASNGRSKLEARLVRGQLQRIAGQASDADRAMEDFILQSLDKFAETKSGMAVNTLLDKMSDTWGLNRLVGTPSGQLTVAKTKGFTAVAKLGLWNMSQAIVQGTAALNVLGKNPIMAAKATRQVMQAVAPEIMGIGKTAEGRRLFNLIDDSGFIAGFNYVELQRVSSKGSDKLLGSRAVRKLWDTNLWPYQLGEGGVRALAWFTEYNILSKQIKTGLVTDIAQDSSKMLQAVNDAANITALNMSRLNQPLISRGILGVPFQFKQFLIQQAEFLFSAKNFRTKGEQIGTWAAWVGAFGIQGMPWMFDLGVLTDTALVAGAEALETLGVDTTSPKYVGASRRVAQESADLFARMAADTKFFRAVTDNIGKERYDDARAFWNRFAQSGALSAITDGELNIASRASLARVFTEYYGSQSLDETLAGPGYQTAKMLIENNISNLGDLINIWRNGDEFTSDYLLGAATKSTRGLPGLQHPLQAADQMLSGEWRDTERRLIKDEVSLTQSLLIGAGFSPAKRGERFERIEFTQKQKEAWKKWSRNRQQRIAKLSEEGHTQYATVLLDDTVDQIKKVNPLMARDFFMTYSQEMLRRNMTDDEKELMYRHQDAAVYDSAYDSFFFSKDTYIGWGGNDND